MAFNDGNLNLVTNINATGPKFFVYLTPDNIATVEGASYFAPFANSELQSLYQYPFSVGDTIKATCSDGETEIKILTINPVTSGVTAVAQAIALAHNEIFVGSAGGVATGVAVTGDVTVNDEGVTAIGPNKVNKAMLATTITPSAVIVFNAQYTTVGGAAAEAIAIAGAVAATDRAYVQLVSAGTNSVSVKLAVVTTNTLTVTFSADPGNNAIINYQLIRATS